MNKIKKALCVLLCAAAAATMLCGCEIEQTQEVSSQSVVSQAATPEPDKPYKIGLVQYAEQPTMDVVREAFMSRLEEWGCDEEQVEIEYQNAGGDAAKAEEICKKLVEDDTDLIVALSQPAADAAAKAAKGSEVKVIFAMADLDESDSVVAGTTAASTVESVVNLALQADPEMKTLGVLYNPDDEVAKTQIAEVKEICTEKRIEIVECKISVADGDRTEEITQKVTELCAKADAVFTPTDSTVASVYAAVSSAARAAQKPLYATEVTLAESGAMAAVSVDYTELGCETADMAVELMNGREPDEISTVTFDSAAVYINQAAVSAVGIALPDSVTADALFLTDSAQQKTE